MELINQVLANPQMKHAIMVHLPVALAVLGVPLVLLASVIKTKRFGLRWFAALAYVVLIVAAVVTVESGEVALDVVPETVPQEARDVAHDHEEMAEKVWMFGLATAILLALTAVPNTTARRIFVALAILASLATAGWVGVVGYHGGVLVYDHGVGTPAMKGPPGEPAAAKPTVDGYTPALRAFTKEQAARVSYLRDIAPLLDKQCLDCHDSDSPVDGVDVSSVAAMLAPAGEHGPTVIPGMPDESPMVLYIRAIKKPRMPKSRSPLTAADLHLIRMWIANGAKDDSLAVEGDRVERLEM
ncbi:MAG: hypothetical protein GY851_34985 [bacterium]|nr:hypothetical protein [bacterium]